MAGNDVFLRSVPSDSDLDDVRLSDPTVAGGGGGVVADFAQTIAAFSLSADADVIVGGALAESIGAFTLAAEASISSPSPGHRYDRRTRRRPFWRRH